MEQVTKPINRHKYIKKFSYVVKVTFQITEEKKFSKIISKYGRPL